MAERTDFNGSNTPKCSKSPCSFQKTGCSFHSFEPILSKRAKKKSPKNLDFSGFFGGELGIRTLGTFLYTAFRVLHLRPLGQLSVYVIPHFFQKLLERTDGKNNKIFNFRTGENPEFTGFLSGANSQLYKKFRVRAVMTTSIPVQKGWPPPPGRRRRRGLRGARRRARARRRCRSRAEPAGRSPA